MRKSKLSETARDSLIVRKQTELVYIKNTPINALNDTISEVPEEQQPRPKQLPGVYYKNFWDFFKISMILAISSLDVGYSLCQTAAVPITVIVKDFNIPLGIGLAHGLLLGIFPFGGIFGAMINSYLVRIWKKKWIYYFIGAVNLISTVMMQITTFQTIVIGRFLLGVTCGMYPMLAPVMTKELTPTSLRPLLGSFFSMGRIVGIVLCFAIGVALQVSNVNNYWRIIFIIPGIIGLTQTIMVFFFVPDVPGDLIQRGQHDKVQEIVRKFYHEEYVHLVIKQYNIDYQLQKSKSKQTDAEDDPYKDNKKRAFAMAIHVNIYTQMMGINTITLMSSTMMDTVQPGLSLYSNLILNSIRLPPTIAATFWVGKKFGRRPLYIWSGIILGLSNYFIALGYVINVNFLIIMFLYVYMFFFSLLYTPINYAYPAEITPAPKITIANIFNQAAMAVSLMFPPIIIEKMNGNGYPVFLFFGIYTTISLIYMYNSLVQTKGKKYQEIIKSF